MLLIVILSRNAKRLYSGIRQSAWKLYYSSTPLWSSTWSTNYCLYLNAQTVPTLFLLPRAHCFLEMSLRSQTSNFSYSPLSLAGNEIRLFLLDPGDHNERISGRLRHVSLHDGIQYAALSKPFSLIFVGGYLGLFNPATHVLNPLLRNPKHTPTSSYPPSRIAASQQLL